jgi:hypothetical protein
MKYLYVYTYHTQITKFQIGEIQKSFYNEQLLSEMKTIRMCNA